VATAAPGGSDRGNLLVGGAVVFALALHAGLLFAEPGLRGGADLKPHLRLMQLFQARPELRNVYAPAYHALGALGLAWPGAATTVKLLQLASAALLLLGFRSLQRAAGLPDAATALFALFPYTFALSHCLPKVEAAGYGLAFAGLAAILRRRPAAVAASLAATFLVHTAAALFLGLVGGVLALARRDRRGLLALGAGALAASPLLAAHLADGCTPAQALLLSAGDYLRSGPRAHPLARWPLLLALANPLLLVLAVAGAGALWRRHRAATVVSASCAVLYANELWLAPLGARTTLDLVRGLTLLALPVAAAAGVWLGARPRALPWVVAACAVWAAGAAFTAVPACCHVEPVHPAEVRRLDVARCTFRWRVRPPAAEASPAPRQGAERSSRASSARIRASAGPPTDSARRSARAAAASSPRTRWASASRQSSSCVGSSRLRPISIQVAAMSDKSSRNAGWWRMGAKPGSPASCSKRL